MSKLLKFTVLTVLSTGLGAVKGALHAWAGTSTLNAALKREIDINCAIKTTSITNAVIWGMTAFIFCYINDETLSELINHVHKLSNLKKVGLKALGLSSFEIIIATAAGFLGYLYQSSENNLAPSLLEQGIISTVGATELNLILLPVFLLLAITCRSFKNSCQKEVSNETTSLTQHRASLFGCCHSDPENYFTSSEESESLSV